MTPQVMRDLATNWATEGDLRMRDLWLMAAEICSRLDDCKGEPVLPAMEADDE